MIGNAAVKPIDVQSNPFALSQCQTYPCCQLTFLQSPPSYLRHHHCEKAISTQLLFQFIFSYACIQKLGFLYNWFADIFIQYDDDQQQLEKLEAASFLGWIFPFFGNNWKQLQGIFQLWRITEMFRSKITYQEGYWWWFKDIVTQGWQMVVTLSFKEHGLQL